MPFVGARRYAQYRAEREQAHKDWLQRKKEREEAEKKRAAHLKALQDKYGGDTHEMPAALREAAVTESEQFVEYDEAGLNAQHIVAAAVAALGADAKALPARA